MGQFLAATTVELTRQSAPADGVPPPLSLLLGEDDLKTYDICN